MRFSPHTEDWKLDSTHFPRVKPFDLFWTRLLKKKSEVDGVADPQLPRKQRAPARTEAGDRVCPFDTHNGSDISARHALFSNLCDAIECIRTRFNKKDFKVYENIQEIILKTIAGKDHEEELTKVTAVYGGTDLQRYKLDPQPSLHSSRHGAVRQWGTTSDLTFLISRTFFNHSKMFAKSYFVRFAHLVSLCLSCRC